MLKLGFEKNKSVYAYNSFGIEVTAACWIQIKEPKELIELFENYQIHENILVLGGGSNILFTQNYTGLIIKIDITGIQSKKTSNGDILVKAGAGIVWNDLVWYCVENEFSGIENMALIPGTVGAAPVQNIGAYGAELMDVFESCEAYDTLTKKIVVLHKKDCEFSYRDSIFKSTAKGRYIITSLTLRLSKKFISKTEYGTIQSELIKQGISNPSIRDMAEIVSKIRVEKLPDPSTIGNAGSFFKNPIVSKEKAESLKTEFPSIVTFNIDDTYVKISAGWMIEFLGWKGKRIGDCGTWQNQALVLVNYGKASGQEIFNFSENILQEVYSKFGIRLEREVNIL